MIEVVNKNKVEGYIKAKRGFTLVEILIVLALIGIVAGLAMQNLGGIFGEEKKKLLRHGSIVLALRINSYLALVGEYPKSLSDLQTPPSGVPPFVNKTSDLNDPWGKPYQYTPQGTSFELWTTPPMVKD